MQIELFEYKVMRCMPHEEDVSPRDIDDGVNSIRTADVSITIWRRSSDLHSIRIFNQNSESVFQSKSSLALRYSQSRAKANPYYSKLRSRRAPNMGDQV